MVDLTRLHTHIQGVTLTIGIKEPLCHCKGDNFDIHIWARLAISSAQEGKLISSLSRANARALHEHRDGIYTELKFVNPQKK